MSFWLEEKKEKSITIIDWAKMKELNISLTQYVLCDYIHKNKTFGDWTDINKTRLSKHLGVSVYVLSKDINDLIKRKIMTDINILFIGDIIGKPGMDLVQTWLPGMPARPAGPTG